MPQQDLCLTPVSRITPTNLCLPLISKLFPNKSVLPGYKPAPDISLPNNQSSKNSRSWVYGYAQYTVLKVITVPLPDVYQFKHPLLASINNCLKLGSGIYLPSVSKLAWSPSLNLKRLTYDWIKIGSPGVFLGFTNISWYSSIMARRLPFKMMYSWLFFFRESIAYLKLQDLNNLLGSSDSW